MASLYIMCGPSGAGKTTWTKDNHYRAYSISSDAIRKMLWGDFKDQRKPSMVFELFHTMIATRMNENLDTIADATHLNLRDLKATVDICVREDVVPFLILVDRPLKVKLRDRDWRPEWLINKHHEKFLFNLPVLTEYAQDNNITIIDARQYDA